MSDEVVAGSVTPGIAFDPIGPVELKSLTETVSLHSRAWRPRIRRPWLGSSVAEQAAHNR